MVEVANFPEFIFYPAIFDAGLEFPKRRSREVAFLQRLERSFRGQHAALDSQVNSLEPL